MALPTALLVKGGIGATTVVLGSVAIAKREDIYYLFNPNNNRELNDKIKALGISDCELENGETKTKECELDEAKVKAIKFDGKTEDTVTGLGENKKLNLVIEKGYTDFKKSEAPNDLYFPEGLRFIFKNPHASEDVTIGSGSNQITLKAGVSYDFKIKTENNSSKLEKAWDLTTLGTKVGLTCQTGDTTECCTIGNSLNVWKDQSNYVLGASVSSGSSSSVTVAKDQKDHNGGFKFTVSADTTINQTDNSKKAGTVDKLTQTSTNNTSYEIDVKDLGGTKTWFLVEKSTPASSVPQESQ